MRPTQAAPWPSSKEDGSKKTHGKTGQQPTHRSHLTDIAMVQQVLGWYDNAVLTGFNAKRQRSGWLVVIKANFSHGPRVAFQNGTTLLDALEGAQKHAEAGTLYWKVDKWAK